MITIKQLFVLALRILGVWLVYSGLHSLIDAGLFKLGYFTYPESSPNYYLVSGLFSTVLGVYLIRGAGAVVRFAYPESDGDESEDQLEEGRITQNDQVEGSPEPRL
jgi:hypothetical protein